MKNVEYLIVGAGMAGAAAARGIREVDGSGAIAVIGSEFDPPYKRPWLSKKLWAGKPLDRVWISPEPEGVELMLGRTVQWLDLAGKQAVDDRGQGYHYAKLLIATGSRPRRLASANSQPIEFHSLQDYRRVRALADEQQRFAVIGGGFIGSEMAAALAMNGKQVTMIFPADTIGDRLFPSGLGRHLNQFYRDKGIDVLSGHEVAGIEERGNERVVRTRNLATGAVDALDVDGIVAGIGAEPNLELAASAGLTVDNGIVVDEFLRTSHPDVYAAGDVARFWQPALGEWRRVEHEDNALTMGRLAGRAMAGAPEPYTGLPYFSSDLFDLGYEAVGDVHARQETVADWIEPFRQGVIYYRRANKVRGVLHWNVWGQVEAARALISAGVPVATGHLAGRCLVPA